jgi:hypothetical protein
MVGTRVELSQTVLKTILSDWAKHGAAAVRKTRETQPAQYVKICALLVPREVRIEHVDPVQQLSDEALETVLAEMQARLDARVRAAKLIEATPEPDDDSKAR